METGIEKEKNIREAWERLKNSCNELESHRKQWESYKNRDELISRAIDIHFPPSLIQKLYRYIKNILINKSE